MIRYRRRHDVPEVHLTPAKVVSIQNLGKGWLQRKDADAMVDPKQRQAIFSGLISNEEGEPVDVAYLGDEAFYVIPDGDFKRHVEAAAVDDAVLAMLREQITDMQDVVVQGVLDFLGKDDLFTKASIDLALKNFEQGFRQADPEQWKPWLGMMGFRVIVDVHGEVVQVEYPQQEIDDL